MSSDVRDILSIDDSSNKRQSLLDKDTLLNATEKKPSKKSENLKRPRNIPRELWGLKDTFGGDFPSILPAPEVQIYKQPKAQITGKVRPWQWTGFMSSARNDQLELFHWKRLDMIDKEQDYYFAQFNKKPVLPKYTNDEYEELLDIDGWTREETDYLMEITEKYDLRFILVQDRWDRERFTTTRSVEDLKERYYMILDILNTTRKDNKTPSDPSLGPGSGWGLDTTCLTFHADHERRRKIQLERIYARTAEQIAEEEQLARALHRIDILKRERQKKTMDLQKLLSQADFAIRSTDSSELAIQTSLLGGDLTRSFLSTSQNRKRNLSSLNIGHSFTSTTSWEGLKFPDLNKNPGVHLRSSEIKLPPTVGIKKTRFVDGFLAYFNIDSCPIPTEDICESFNSLRCDILLIQELYATLSHLEYELCSYREKYNKRLSDSGAMADTHKNVPSHLQSTHVAHFSSSANLQLGAALQSAIRAADVKQRNAITALNLPTSGLSPPGTRSSAAATGSAPASDSVSGSGTIATVPITGGFSSTSNAGHGSTGDARELGVIRKRRRPPSDDRLFSPSGSETSRKSLKKIRHSAQYFMKKRL